jgi:hypothetical protein
LEIRRVVVVGGLAEQSEVSQREVVVDSGIVQRLGRSLEGSSSCIELLFVEVGDAVVELAASVESAAGC